MRSYLVVDSHLGDKLYNIGDTREADPRTVAHLVPSFLMPLGNDADDAMAMDERDKELARLATLLDEATNSAASEIGELKTENTDLVSQIVAVTTDAQVKVSEVEKKLEDMTAERDRFLSELEAVRLAAGQGDKDGAEPENKAAPVAANKASRTAPNK